MLAQSFSEAGFLLLEQRLVDVVPERTLDGHGKAIPLFHEERTDFSDW